MSEEVSKTALTVEIVANYLAKNQVPIDKLPSLIRTISETLESIDQPEAPSEEPSKPTAAQIKKSIRPEALISFIDGKPYKTLKRHLSKNGLTIADYKARYALPSDYPTTAPDYSAKRSAMARSLGLGNRKTPETPVAPMPKTRGRPKRATAA